MLFTFREFALRDQKKSRRRKLNKFRVCEQKEKRIKKQSSHEDIIVRFESHAAGESKNTIRKWKDEIGKVVFISSRAFDTSAMSRVLILVNSKFINEALSYEAFEAFDDHVCRLKVQFKFGATEKSTIQTYFYPAATKEIYFHLLGFP